MELTPLLEMCLKVTGAFENGTPKFDRVTGNADGEGISAGILQWNAGQGTLQKLVQAIGAAMGWDNARTFFSSDIEQFSTLAPSVALVFTRQHYLDPSGKLSRAAALAWRSFLATPESVAAQQAYAETTTLAAARRLAAEYVPEAADHTRVVAFFFDLVNQQGSMSSVKPAKGTGAEALAFAKTQNIVCANLWAAAAAADPLADQLLFYAYERAKLARPRYVWDSLARRGTIAARRGIVHATSIDLTHVLD